MTKEKVKDDPSYNLSYLWRSDVKMKIAPKTSYRFCFLFDSFYPKRLVPQEDLIPSVTSSCDLALPPSSARRRRRRARVLRPSPRVPSSTRRHSLLHPSPRARRPKHIAARAVLLPLPARPPAVIRATDLPPRAGSSARRRVLLHPPLPRASSSAATVRVDLLPPPARSPTRHPSSTRPAAARGLLHPVPRAPPPAPAALVV